MSAPRRWPLFLIASPAAVAVWSGWVGLGSLCGFGRIHPLPGIWDGFTVDTAITLPVGVEAYGAYALGAWLAPGAPAAARRFARGSAIGALALGMLGQVVYHLLAAAHATRAPWPVVVLVSCLPVVTLGFGAALTHLLRAPGAPETAPETAGAPVPASAPVPAPEPVPVAAPAPVSAPEPLGLDAVLAAGNAAGASALPGMPEPVPAGSNGHDAALKYAADRYAAGLAAGDVPSLRRIRADLKCGQDRARRVQAHLESLTPAGQSIRQLRDEMRSEGGAS